MKKKSQVGPRNPKTKILSVRSAAQARVKLNRSQKKLVFTNGVFDILHPGHTTYLNEARTLGDALVVAVNSDDSVRRLKGPGRPVHSLKDRMLVLAALESVDYVISFSESTPLETILAIRPNVLVKGADYQISQVVGAREVQSWGGSVKLIRFVEGKSTTRTLKKIRG